MGRELDAVKAIKKAFILIEPTFAFDADKREVWTYTSGDMMLRTAINGKGMEYVFSEISSGKVIFTEVFDTVTRANKLTVNVTFNELLLYRMMAG